MTSTNDSSPPEPMRLRASENAFSQFGKDCPPDPALPGLAASLTRHMYLMGASGHGPGFGRATPRQSHDETESGAEVLRRMLALQVGEAFELNVRPADLDEFGMPVRNGRSRDDVSKEFRNAENAMLAVARMLGWRIRLSGNLVIRELARPTDLQSPRRRFAPGLTAGEVRKPVELLAAREELAQSRLMDAERVRGMKAGDSFTVEATEKRATERRTWIRQAALFSGKVIELERLTPKRRENEPKPATVAFVVRCLGEQPVSAVSREGGR